MKRLQVRATDKHPELTVLVDNDIAQLIAEEAAKGRHLNVTVIELRHGEYYRVCIGRNPLARLIMGDPKGLEVDHINGDLLDNRRRNLRVCTHKENSRNRRGWSKLGYKGVRHIGQHFQAWITVDRRPIYLGRAKSPEDSASLYDAAARHYFGEFAFVNFPRPGERTGEVCLRRPSETPSG